ncbi:MAG: LD-carboxypeptidase [Cyanobacteria bacterium]|nr:LD-carboxypeptidase [Cyanobacteriota bacterium]
MHHTERSEWLLSPLQRGDEVALVATSSALDNTDNLLRGISILDSWGLRIRPDVISQRRWGYLAGRDDERRSDFQAVPNAPLLACARGGWGAARLLERPFVWQQGWLLGFSDVTALLCARMAAGVSGGVHGPLITTLADEPEWSQRRLHDLLFGHPLPDLQGVSWRGGVAVGPLLTLNLTVASHLIGTPFLPDLSGVVLVIEDIGEAPYRIDRMLTQWRLAGLLQSLAGLGFGRFLGCDHESDSGGFSLDEVLRERTADLGIPVVANLLVGHGPGGNAALPVGAIATLDGDQGVLSVGANPGVQPAPQQPQ